MTGGEIVMAGAHSS